MKQQHSTFDLSIVIPAYREEKRIGKTLDQLATYIQKTDFIEEKNLEVIVVSADSPDQTHHVVEQKAKLFTNFRLITPGPKVGKGRDVKAGVLVAKGRAVLFMDADLATPLKYIKLFYEAYLTGADVVIAVRDLSHYRHNVPRIVISGVGNMLFRIAGGVWVEDSQCGFKLFSAQAAHICFSSLQIKGWGFDMEVLAAAKANKLVIQTIHVPDWVDVPYGTFEDNTLVNALVSLADLGLILGKRLSGKYKEDGDKQ